MSEHGDVAGHWMEAENRLYPVINLRPDLYEAAVGVVRTLADHLGAIPDQDALVTSYSAASRSEDFAAAGIDEGSIPPEIDRDMVRGAAYQIRARELTQRAAQDAAARAIMRARQSGQAICTVWAYGDNELYPPYRRVDMAVDTGFAIVQSTEVDPDTMRPWFVLEAVQLDPDTGNDEGADPIVERREFRDVESWRAAAAELRRTLLNDKET